MNRPRVVGILSAMIGSTAGFLVLHRWRLAGTLTGAAAMPLIYTLVTHCSHASLERLRNWTHRRVRKGDDPAAAEATAADEAAQPTETGAAQPAEPATTPVPEPPTPRSPRPAGRVLQWAAATLAFLAFAGSVYSLSHLDAGTTILRERVVQTVTVTTERSPLWSANSGSADVAAAVVLPGGQDASTTTTASGGEPSATTVSTVAGSGGTTTTTLPQ
jgi:hypothetical protein